MATMAVNNGVNVQALLDAREALKGAPEAAKFAWRASCKWQNGTHSESKVQGFFGLGQEQSHRTETSFSADHPEIFASEDKGVTPAVRQDASPTSRYSTGVTPLSSEAKISG